MSEHDEEFWPGELRDEDDAEAEPAEPEDDEDTGEGPAVEDEPEAAPPSGHAPGELEIPIDVDLIEGAAHNTNKRIAIVLSRFNGDVTNRLLESALTELAQAGIERQHVTVMPVPGAFELPLGAMALAKTRRYVAVIALGCVIRGETAHFEYVAGEAASGLQLAALETGVPVSFGVLTTDNLQQAMARVDKGGEAVRTALEMADLFNQLRASAKANA